MPSKPNPRYANGAKRTALRRRVLHEETTCHLCGGDVDTTLPPGLPASPEIDEVIPISLGGNPLDRSNVRLAHRLCNQRRGNKPLDPDRLADTTSPPAPLATTSRLTTRTWTPQGGSPHPNHPSAPKA